MDETEFLFNLEKVYRIVKHLNKDYSNYLYAYKSILQNISENSNVSFNINYILDNLVPLWNKTPKDINDYLKKRNWIFTGSIALDNKEFIKRLNEDKAILKTNLLLKSLYQEMQKGVFVEPENIGIKRELDSPFIWKLIKEYNLKSFGVTTLKLYKNRKIVIDYLEYCENLYTSYNKDYIECTKKRNTFESSEFYPSINNIYENTGINKRTVSNILKTNIKSDDCNNLKEKVYILLSNPASLNFERVEINGSTRINVIPVYKVLDVSLPCLMSEDAFDYSVPLEESPLNCSEDKAKGEGFTFYISWLLFQNQTSTEYEREYIRNNYINFYNSKTKPISFNTKDSSWSLAM